MQGRCGSWWASKEVWFHGTPINRLRCGKINRNKRILKTILRRHKMPSCLCNNNKKFYSSSNRWWMVIRISSSWLMLRRWWQIKGSNSFKNETIAKINNQFNNNKSDLIVKWASIKRVNLYTSVANRKDLWMPECRIMVNSNNLATIIGLNHFRIINNRSMAIIIDKISNSI